MAAACISASIPAKNLSTASRPVPPYFGRDVRNLISGAEYGSLFETELAADSHAKGKWHTSAGGVYYSVGIGGAVLGRGAHVMLIDDPFASMDDDRRSQAAS
jgi:hypothetical protein